MIALLTGQIAFRSVDQVILDVGGVGYRLMIPLSTFYALPDDGDLCLHVHTHVKEDAIHLFGFLTAREKEMFALLISVSGVGPKLAMNILSNCATADLQSALQDGNVARLSAIPGIGKKSAERLILELREKAKNQGESPPPANTGVKLPAANPLDDALSALVNLGYKEVHARKALDSINICPGASIEDILKGALKVLMK
ncbi:MAG: Holliday junction branch migration protein RuvA [Desulfuromonadales bacterium]|jgi:Holliday junction DNA helicase RuvA